MLLNNIICSKFNIKAHGGLLFLTVSMVCRSIPEVDYVCAIAH